MAPPSVSWTFIPSTDLDPDSPITTELMVALYENGLFNNEWMGDESNADVNHAHTGLTGDGTAPVDAGDLANADSIFQSELFQTDHEDKNGGAIVTQNTGALLGPPVYCITKVYTYFWDTATAPPSTNGYEWHGCVIATGPAQRCTRDNTPVNAQATAAAIQFNGSIGENAGGTNQSLMQVSTFGAGGIIYAGTALPGGIGTDSYQWTIDLYVLETV